MYARYLVVVIAATALMVSSCGEIPDPRVRIISPQNGAVILVSEGTTPHFWQWSPGTITFTADNIPQPGGGECPYPAVMINPRDNGESFRGIPVNPSTGTCSSTPPSQEESWTWIPNSLGLHTLSAQVIIIFSDGRYREFTSTSINVCVMADPNRPPQDIPIGQVTADCNPAPPTVTPVPPVIIRPNPHNPGGTNPSGCAAQTNQSDCNLAGCSWNPQNSTCSVNP